MVRGGEAGSPGGPGGRPTASGKTNPSPGRGGPGAVPPQVAKPTPAPVGGIRGAVPPQVAKPTPAPVGGVRGVVPPQVAKPTPAPIVGVRGVVPPDRYCGPTAQLAKPASMGRRPGHPSDRSPSRRQRARGTPLSTGRPGPSWVQPPAGRSRSLSLPCAAPGTQAGSCRIPRRTQPGLGRCDRSGQSARCWTAQQLTVDLGDVNPGHDDRLPW